MVSNRYGVCTWREKNAASCTNYNITRNHGCNFTDGWVLKWEIGIGFRIVYLLNYVFWHPDLPYCARNGLIGFIFRQSPQTMYAYLARNLRLRLPPQVINANVSDLHLATNSLLLRAVQNRIIKVPIGSYRPKQWEPIKSTKTTTTKKTATSITTTKTRTTATTNTI